MNYERNFLGWLFGHDYFVQTSQRGHYEYFDKQDDAFQWAADNRPAKVYRIPRGSEFSGEKGKTPAIGDPDRDIGNATLIATVK